MSWLGLPVSMYPHLKPRAQESTMELWAQEGARDEDVDLIEAVIEESDKAEDDLVKNAICEAPHQSCQVWGHVREEGTRWC
jgi:hypothetical protein